MFSHYDYDDAPRTRRTHTFNCGGWASYNGPCGAYDCASCYPGGCGSENTEPEEQETRTSRTVTARKARYVGTSREIRPGDKVRVTSGFTYEPNGRRTGYLPKRYQRIAKGPAWESAAA